MYIPPRLLALLTICNTRFSTARMAKPEAPWAAVVDFVEHDKWAFSMTYSDISEENLEACQDIASDIMDVLERMYDNIDIEVNDPDGFIVNTAVFIEACQKGIERNRENAKKFRLTIKFSREFGAS